MTQTTDVQWPRRVGILGVGLLGGSVAMSIRRTRPETTMVGFARSAAKRDYLKANGIVDLAVDSIEEASRDCDVVVVATPVSRIAEMVVDAARLSPEACLVTDVGSTKQRIVDAVSKHPVAERKFVAAHPIAGSEKSGPEYASKTLFDGKMVVLTPSEPTDASRLQSADQFWRMTGAQTVEMTPAQHDAHLAAISHVPHLVSALVAKMTKPEARPLVGSGWQDITRVAAGDPELWTAICQENRSAIQRELGQFTEQLDRLRRLLDECDDDGLQQWLCEAKNIKEQTRSTNRA